MTKTLVTFTAGLHLRQEVTGTFELINDYTEWGGQIGGENARRVGTQGVGYLKVYGEDFRGNTRVFKVTVQGKGVGYTIHQEDEVAEEVATEADELLAEIAALKAQLETLTGGERAKFRKRLVRREAKLATLTA